ncbi:OmpA family protein [Pseudochryseolinea flava]|uniref:OmpA-like domain-containing protein n=1 Tax=Pseudochryseolinea flava TaxID=2059302 RepID=A0A364XXJ0_9BACT|nr:OmpA family protein [Pseudochryseolinea flava]RAV99017.1 hypothetical protein DQQ10_20695 [Pseudochryseolinea flava]
MKSCVVFNLRKFYWLSLCLLLFACAKPLAVSHLSPEGIALTKKKGYGMPTHNFFSRFICFDRKCLKKAAWVKSQKKHRFKGYKNPHGLPSYHDRRTIKKDSSIIAGLPVPTQPSPEQKNAAVSPPVKRDSIITLNAILFERDHHRLKKESYPRLDSVVNYLKANASLKVSIYGHADNQGTEQYNLRLSEKRAESVAIYFVDNGVASERVDFDGFGSAKPVGDNTTFLGRQMNRRVEIVIHRK